MASLNRGVARGVTKVYTDALDDALDAGLGPTQPTLMQRDGVVEEFSGPNAKQANITWMRNYSVARQWVGERDLSMDRRFFEMLMVNSKYENSVGVDIEDIEDGRITEDGAETDMQALVRGYEDLKMHQFNDRLVNAFNSTHIGGSITGSYGQTIYQGSVDGEPLISNSHPYYEQIDFDPTRPAGEQLVLSDQGTFSNYTTDKFDEAALWTARQTMMEYVDFRGRPAPANADLLVVSPKYEQEARQILERSLKEESSAAVDNETQGLFDLYVDPWLAKDGNEEKWFLLDTTNAASPFLLWNRVPVQEQRAFGDSLDENAASGDVSWPVFKEDAMFFGVRARHGWAYGAPQTIYGSDGTGS